MNELGLRERNKIKRQRLIVSTALELFAQHGYDATTVADIAEAADIAPRTVSLYFPTKQDIVLSSVDAAADRLLEVLRERSAEQSPIEAFGDWIRSELTRLDGPAIELSHRVYCRNPELAALSAIRMEPALAEIRRIIAEQLGVDVEDPRPRIAVAAIKGVFEHVWTAATAQHIDDMIDLNVRFLMAGLKGLSDFEVARANRVAEPAS